MSQQSTPPPGWYFDGTATRWWDGTQWTSAVAGQAPTGWQQPAPNRTIAIFAHLSCLIGGFVLALVLYFVAKDKDDEFNRFHTTEALNFQLTMGIIFMLAMGAYMTVVVTTFGVGPGQDPGAGFAVGVLACFGVFFLAGIASLVFGVIGAMKASNGEYWRYPFSIRFVDRGLMPPSSAQQGASRK
jgi:uncharacterized Tic20 family protein